VVFVNFVSLVTAAVGPSQENCHGSDTQRTRRQSRASRRRRQGDAGLRAQLPAAAQARAGGERQQQAPDRAREEARRGAGHGREGRRRGDIDIARRVGENDTLYGSVTSADIAQALHAKGFEIDKRKITLPEPLKALGETVVPVKIHRDVTAQVKVRVVAENKS
jgi:ribosomal protein L9